MKKLFFIIAAVLAACILCVNACAQQIVDYGEEICKEYIRLYKSGDKEAFEEFCDYYIYEDGGVLYKELDTKYFSSDENYIMTVKFGPAFNDYQDYDDRFHIYFMLTDGTEYSTFDKRENGNKRWFCEKERQLYTTKEILKKSGVTDTDKIFFAWLYYGNGYDYDTDVESITFSPCQKGWNTIDGEKYYVKADGTLATANLTIGGIRYNFGKSGVCEGKYTGLEKTKKGRRYYKNGKALANADVKRNGITLHTDKNGYVSEEDARLSDFDLPTSEEFSLLNVCENVLVPKKIPVETGWSKQSMLCVNVGGEYYEISENLHSESLGDWEKLDAEAHDELFLNGYDDVRRADAFALYNGGSDEMPAKLYRLSDSSILIADYNLRDSDGKAVGAVSAMSEVQYRVCRKPEDRQLFQKGWNFVGKEMYYITEQHIETTGKAIIDGVCYEFTNQGVFVGRYTGWLRIGGIGGGMQYREDGVPLCNTEITLSGGRKYRLDASGFGTRIV